MAAAVDIPGALVVVTGAGSGIGAATAVAFARHGARVVSVDLDAGAAKKTAASCAGAGAKVGSETGAKMGSETGAKVGSETGAKVGYEIGAKVGSDARSEVGSDAGSYACDVRSAAAVADLAVRVAGDHGPVDILVNNAGVGMTGRFADMTLDDWEWIRSVNLDGVVHGCHAFGPGMLERGRGHVVNLSSGLAYTPRATEPAYVATKAAVLALSQCLRADWRPRGVGVTAVCPGVINTPIIDRTRFLGDQAGSANRERATRLFRRGHAPAKVADAILDAVPRDRVVATPGWEAGLGWWLHRGLPLRATQALARSR